MTTIFGFKKVKTKFIILKCNQILKLSNNKPIQSSSKDFVQTLVNRLNSVNTKKLNNEIIQIICFSENLNKTDRKKIINEILYQLNFDEILYRTENPKVNKIMDTKLKKYILNFGKKFDINFKISSKRLFYQKNLKINKFKKFLESLNNDMLTVLYKLCKLESSPILSYFFFSKLISYKMFYELSNIEFIHNLDKNEISDELNNFINDRKKNIKNISKFFNLFP
ncbi:hypothetical protein OBA28_01665 [Alphaproteobacteria bacterium]|nr:hypothetical protein [Alphaproteobacteria bacterium]